MGMQNGVGYSAAILTNSVRPFLCVLSILDTNATTINAEAAMPVSTLVTDVGKSLAVAEDVNELYTHLMSISSFYYSYA